MIKKILYKLLDLINRNNLYYISINKIEKKILKNEISSSKVNLNIGSGGYNIEGFIDLDIKSDKYNKERAKSFVEYDIRNDELPYKDNTVDNIYCSHVIEHIEEKYVSNFFKETGRVLKKNGILRISTPDAKFLWKMMLKGKDYWRTERYENWFKSRNHDYINFDEIDFFIREIATAKLRIFSEKNLNYYNQVKDNMHDYDKVLDILGNNKLDPNNIGYHITAWDFDKILKLSSNFFSDIIESKYRSSISNDMRSEAFDKTCPEMSLYVDFRK